ncbi:UNVERIFIED_CONTAM: NADH-ubiquinone oxidoreductase chain 2 [Sesamum calycinum]|uniref:NADH-ubiquinone oxidoreductase chain 2 n=1 Tax=Sesamum calycinum TaxID=2727403 RepID=A0AAW2KFT7_9LAMI
MCNDGDSTFILGLAAGLASLPSRLECSLPAEDRNVTVSPEIFIINATFILLIHGVVFSTSKKYDYPPLVSNVGWLGLLSVARLGGQRALGCGGAIIVQLPNLMRHRVWTAGNHSMGGRLILLPPQGWLIVPVQVRRRSVLETAAAARGVNDRTCCNLGITRQLFRSIGIGGHSTILLGGGLFARVTDPAIMYSYLYTGNRSRAYIRQSSCVNSREERKGGR